MSGAQILIPSRVFICGMSEGGKTTEAIRVIDQVMGSTCDRFVAICPTYWSQSKFRVLDKWIKSKSDIIVKPRKGLFTQLYDNLKDIHDSRVAKGKNPPHTILFIDDLAGTPFVQNRGMGDFSNLVIQTPHIMTSIVSIFQQPKMADYTLRANANVIVSFPSTREADMEWLLSEYKHPALSKNDFKDIVNGAWNGLRNDHKEWGTHFLVITSGKRKPTKYYMDWNFRLNKKKADENFKTKDKRPKKKQRIL